ncbi:FAD-binding oxidoreductase [Taklimakanibacter deserti]|uniref:FAD-binding oxidoreductase n=1 Tax=Taklimakanibacter deserti TaxID=2267839 RepID=UPI000E65CB34
MRGPDRRLAACLAGLRELLDTRCSTGQSLRELHARDEGWHLPGLPDAVCFPKTAPEVASIVTLCRRHAVPVIAFGTGSGMEGQINAVQGGISVDLSGLDQILEVNAGDMDCRVEAGVRRMTLNTHLRDTGLFFPVDPGADASLGGMAATRASGPNAMRYGTMRDNVLALEAVLGTGEIITTGTRARKSSAGYDLTRLLIGSEGTLAIITKLCLRLHALPEALRTARVHASDLQSLLDYAIALMQAGIGMAKLEVMDEVAVRAVNLYAGLGLEEEPTLLVEFAGSAATIDHEVDFALALAEDFDLPKPVWAASPEDRSRLWKARHEVAHAETLLRPGSRSLVTDVCVPISRIARCIAETRADLATIDLIASIVGHIGDGNFHVSMLIDSGDSREIALAEAAHDRLIDRALAMGGTSTGEHGIGLGKMTHLRREMGGGVDVMRAIKQVFDPDLILNPGKIF